MRVNVIMKQASSRKAVLNAVSFELEQPETVKDLLIQMVTLCVKQYHQRIELQSFLHVLSQEEIIEGMNTGKLRLGILDNTKQVNLQQAIEAVIHGFEDGLIVLFVDHQRQESLEDLLEIHEGSELIFVKLAMLSGRLW